MMHSMRMRISRHLLAGAGLAALAPLSARAQTQGPILAVFAHPDDERVIGPLMSKLAREGRETHLVIATDGAKGITPFAHIPAGPRLAAVRAKEASCAADRLHTHLHMLGLPDGGLASFDVLARLRSKLAAVIDSVKPVAIITFGPEGGTGHPDHRLVGDVTSQVVQANPDYATTIDLLYASLPTELLRTAPRARPTVNGMAESVLTVRVPFDDQDLAAGRAEYACHRSQYLPAAMDSVNAYLAHAWNGTVWLRPWNGTMHHEGLFR